MISRASIFFILLSGCFTLALAQHPSVGNRFQLDKRRGCAPLDINITINLPSLCDGANPCTVDFGEGAGFEPFTTSKTYSAPGTYVLTIIFGASGSDQITVEVLPDIQPEFEIYSCGANTVVVKVTDTNYDQYTISYSDGFSIVVPSGSLATNTHAFATSGAKTVSVQGRKLGYEDNCSPMIKNVTVSPTLSNGAITQLTVSSPTEIQLTFNNPQFTLYKLEISRNSTTFQPFRDVYNSSSLMVGNLRTDDDYHCFRLGTYDPCSGVIIAYSNTICSANFDVTAQSEVNKLEWKTSATGISSYSISKTDLTTTFTPLTASPPALSVDDTDVDCTVNYFYQLTATYANGSTSVSLTKDVTAFSSVVPTAPENITATVNSNSVNLEWQQDPAFIPIGYAVYKIADGAISLLTTTTSTSATDPAYNTLIGTCYKISYTDNCGNKSPFSIEACPVQLTGTVDKNNSILLTWTGYTGWLNGVNSYTVQRFDSQGQLLQTFPGITTTTFTDDTTDPANQVYTYVIQAIPNDGGITNAVSNAITIVKETNIFYPTAFTPNGDDLNDTFIVSGQFLVKFEMNIFNRWGELVYTTNDQSAGWDGMYKGNPMPEGTYAFIAKFTDLAGRTSNRSGAVLLLKKNN